MNELLKLVILFFLCFGLSPSCTTTRPLTIKEVKQQRIKDTLLLKTTVVNNPVQTVTVIKRDTLFSERLTKEITNNLYLDTSKLASLIDRYHSQSVLEIEQLQSTIAVLQKLLDKDRLGALRAQGVMQYRLDTTVKNERAAKETLASSTKVIYEVPKYIYLVLAVIGIVVFLYYYYLKKKLQIAIKKQRNHA